MKALFFTFTFVFFRAPAVRKICAFTMSDGGWNSKDVKWYVSYVVVKWHILMHHIYI